MIEMADRCLSRGAPPGVTDSSHSKYRVSRQFFSSAGWALTGAVEVTFGLSSFLNQFSPAIVFFMLLLKLGQGVKCIMRKS